MEFMWSDSGDTSVAEKEVWQALKLVFQNGGNDGVCYHRFPILSADRTKREPDILVLHREFGAFVISCLGLRMENIVRIDGQNWVLTDWSSKQETPVTQAEDQLMNILGKFRNESGLRQGRKDLIQGHIMVALPFINSLEWKNRNITALSGFTILFSDDLEPSRVRRKFEETQVEEKQEPITQDKWALAISILQGGPVLRRPLRPLPANSKSKAFMLREVEQQMMSIDREQSKVAIQIPDGPQRIRGLSGSGKTVVMCMKAAWMHLRFPDWEIVYTFYTKSLYGMIKNLITRFYRYYAEEDPNWEKIHVLHGWGGKEIPGLYTTIAKKLGMPIRTYIEATQLFAFKEQNELLGKCCEELLNSPIELELFDAVLIDEGQDFNFNFYRLCHKALRQPKRLVWAYDEVQSLESLKIPTAIDIFGISNDGSPLVDLEGSYANGEIEKDIILYRCYRTPRPVLVVAHAFGMGLLRSEGAVQFIPTIGGWQDIGYEVAQSEIVVGKDLTIRRPIENSPHILEKLVGYNELVQYKKFDDRDAELTWVADNIASNIKNDELKPEEILVISLDWKKSRTIIPSLKQKLLERKIESIRPGYDTTSDVFQMKDCVTVTNIFPAKGNEASVVYVICFEQVGMNPRLIVQERNQAFTAMTRTRGWCVLTGVGNQAEVLFEEIAAIMRDPEQITFKAPDPRRIQRNLDSLEYERHRQREKKAKDLAYQLRVILTEINDPKLRKSILDNLGGQ